jgi:hypothetical protein
MEPPFNNPLDLALSGDGCGLFRKWGGLCQPAWPTGFERQEKSPKRRIPIGNWALCELQRLCHMAEVRPTPGHVAQPFMPALSG